MKKEYYQKHRQEVLAKNREWKLAHSEKVKQNALAYRERTKLLMQEYRKQHREKRKKDNRAYHDRHPEIFIKNSRQWREHNPEKLVHHQVGRAIKSGLITKPTKCSRCGKEDRLFAHHEDYTKPLEVLWVCRPCHYVMHHEKPAAHEPRRVTRGQVDKWADQAYLCTEQEAPEVIRMILADLGIVVEP